MFDETMIPTQPPASGKNFSALEISNARGGKGEKDGAGYKMQCLNPAGHSNGDKTPSAMVKDAPDGGLIFACHKGCDPKKLWAIAKDAGLVGSAKHGNNKQLDQIVAVYSYQDERGSVVCEKVRKQSKKFLWRRPDPGKPGEWIWNREKQHFDLIYRLPECLKAIASSQTIYIAEGEKDVENLIKLGLVATCNPDGASQEAAKPKWTDAHTRWLNGLREAVILPDNDDAGRAHAEAVAKSLTAAGIKCKILELPNLPEKGDVSDWIDNGGTLEKLLELECLAQHWQSSTGTESGGNLWNENDIPEGYKIRDTGVTNCKGDKPFLICHCPAWVSAIGRNSKQGTSWGHLVHWIDQDGNHKKQSIAGSSFHVAATEIAKDFEDRGLPIVVGKVNQFLQYLQAFKPAARYQVTSKLGWFDDDAELAFMLAGEAIGKLTDDEQLIFQADQYSPSTASMNSSGTLEQWQDQVYGSCTPHPLLLFPILVALTGPLLKILGKDSFGFHFWGASSGGKTTALQVGASVWGCGADPAVAPGKSFVQSWSTTAGAFEGLAVAHSDMLLPMDELHKCDAKNFTAAVYTLFGGQGKNALSRNRELREKRTWRLIGLSSGEMSMREKIEKEDGSAKTGELVRVIDVEVAGEFGVIHTEDGAPISKARAKETIDGIKESCGKFYGSAGPAFIRALIARYSNFNDLKAVVEQKQKEAERLLMTLAASGSNPEMRVIGRFALVQVAGELARDLGILAPDCSVSDTVQAVFKIWLPQSAVLSDADRGVLAVRDFLSKHWQSRFVPLKKLSTDGEQDPDTSKTHQNIAGYTDENYFIFNQIGFTEACGSASKSEVANALKKAGLLSCSGQRLQKQVRIGKELPWLYHVARRILEL